MYSNLKLYKLAVTKDTEVTKMEFAVDCETALRKAGFGHEIRTITKFLPGHESILPIIRAELLSHGKEPV